MELSAPPLKTGTKYFGLRPGVFFMGEESRMSLKPHVACPVK